MHTPANDPEQVSEDVKYMRPLNYIAQPEEIEL